MKPVGKTEPESGSDVAKSISPTLSVALDAVRTREHFVQFYENESSLIESIFAYFSKGFLQGDAAVMIATRTHRKALEERFEKAGVDLAGLREAGKYFVYDAAETLGHFMNNGQPDPKRFRALIGSVISAAAAKGSSVRAFGEMVSILWDEGNKDAAIELEVLWNDLAEILPFTLFCAYGTHQFTEADKGRPLAHICRAHNRIIGSPIAA